MSTICTHYNKMATNTGEGSNFQYRKTIGKKEKGPQLSGLVFTSDVEKLKYDKWASICIMP